MKAVKIITRSQIPLVLDKDGKVFGVFTVYENEVYDLSSYEDFQAKALRALVSSGKAAECHEDFADLPEGVLQQGKPTEVHRDTQAAGPATATEDSSEASTEDSKEGSKEGKPKRRTKAEKEADDLAAAQAAAGSDSTEQGSQEQSSSE